MKKEQTIFRPISLIFLCLGFSLPNCTCKRTSTSSTTEHTATVASTDGSQEDWVLGLASQLPSDSLEGVSTWIVTKFKSLSSLGPEAFRKEFSKSLRAKLAKRYSSREEVFRLATELFTARNEVRLLEPLPIAKVGAFELDFATREVLYAAHILYPLKVEPWVWRSGGQVNCQGRLSGSSICAGDIVLSRSVAFTAALFGFWSLDSTAFSHVGTVTKTLSAQESRIVDTDSTGYHDSKLNLLEGSPRFSVYRRKANPIPSGQMLAETVTRMGRFGFNYTLNPQCSSGRYSCSEAIYCASRDLRGGTEASNPYNKSLWTEPGEREKAAREEFGKKISRLYWGAIPLPGDMEFSSEFEPALHVIQPAFLPEMRAYEALIRQFILTLGEEKGLRDEYLAFLSKKTTGNGVSTALKALGTQAFQGLGRVEKLGADEIDPKSMLMYAHFHFSIMPAAARELMSEMASKPMSFSTLEGRAKEKLVTKLRNVIR